MSGYQVEPKKFGMHVRGLRKARGMTQEVLGRCAALSSDTIRRLETGTFSPSLVTLEKLAGGLDLRLSTIFEGYEVGSVERRREFEDLVGGLSEEEVEMVMEVIRAVLKATKG